LLVGINADEVIERIRRFNPGLYIFLLTGCDQKLLKPLQTIQEMDIQFYCEKSSSIDNILLNIENAIKSIAFLKQGKIGFPLRLRQLRQASKISQDTLAKYVGLGRTAVANWEAGLTEPNAENLRKIATFFQVSIDYLLCYNNI
jgi:DNA-binding XRE family transcriptional regulator